MTAEEAAYIMMNGGGKAVIEALQVSKNGVYNATGNVDGYSPVTVAVADRYTEGYADGESSGYEKGKKDAEDELQAKIQSLTVTKNGTYSASSYGLIGFDPVEVNVPTKDKEIDDLKHYIETMYPDESDNIGAITGTAEFCKAENEGDKYSYTFRTALGPKGTGLYNSDTYAMYIYVTRNDGEEYTITTRIPTKTTDTSCDPPKYGADAFGKCCYWTMDNDGNAVLHWRYTMYGAWSSYDQWNTTLYPTN